MSQRTLLVIGSGPGIGRSLATTFASHGFNHIILMSRNRQRLEDDKSTVLSKAPKATVETLAVDISDPKALTSTLNTLNRLGNVECVFFNAARVEPSKLLDFPAEQIESDFKVSEPQLVLSSITDWNTDHKYCSVYGGPVGDPSPGEARRELPGCKAITASYQQSSLCSANAVCLFVDHGQGGAEVFGSVSGYDLQRARRACRSD